jgi:hypothetical protein
VFCGSIWRQSAGVDAANTSAVVKGFFVGCPVAGGSAAVAFTADIQATAAIAATAHPRMPLAIAMLRLNFFMFRRPLRAVTRRP